MQYHRSETTMSKLQKGKIEALMRVTAHCFTSGRTFLPIRHEIKITRFWCFSAGFYKGFFQLEISTYNVQGNKLKVAPVTENMRCN